MNNEQTSPPERPFALWATLFLLIGWFAPAYSVSRGLGDPLLTDIVKSIFPELLRTESKSLFGTMLSLISSGGVGSTILGLAVLLFTFVFPAAKILLILFHDRLQSIDGWFKKLGHWMLHSGKWSMLDVFVIAILIVSLGDFKGL